MSETAQIYLRQASYEEIVIRLSDGLLFRKGFKEYDWQKLRSILEESDGKIVEVGIAEDWYYTSEQLTVEAVERREIAGIKGSIWGTPVVVIDGNVKSCFVGG